MKKDQKGEKFTKKTKLGTPQGVNQLKGVTKTVFSSDVF